MLFSNFSYPEECEYLDFGETFGGELMVDLNQTDGRFRVGDSLVLSARFSADYATPSGLNYTISENGGLVLMDVYRLDWDINALEPALTFPARYLTRILTAE